MAWLLKPFAVKPVFATIEQRLVIRQFGAFQAEDQGALRQAIAETIGWNRGLKGISTLKTQVFDVYAFPKAYE